MFLTSLIVLWSLQFAAAPNATTQQKYFVDSAGCKMPFVEPFPKDILKIMNVNNFTTCRKNRDLVVSEYDYDLKLYRLHIQDDRENWADSPDDDSTLECKYVRIDRDLEKRAPDNWFHVLYKRKLTQDMLVSPEVDYILVKCFKRTVENELKVIQLDGIAFVQDLEATASKEITELTKKRSKPNVIIFGLDSMSRTNFRRTMRKSFEYVQKRGWFTMQGLNKIGDNTLPNLLAVLTGLSEQIVSTICDMKVPGCFDKLPFIWNDFHRINYTTAMGEDCVNVNTFNYLKPGFIKKPVDYYLRPLLMAIYLNYPNVTTSCLGRHLNFAYVWDFAQQFIQRFLHTTKPMFGLFWSNSYTHTYWDESFALDELFVEYLKQFERDGLFNSSIVILMSDHGSRYGNLRRASSGYLEERMPMLYIYLPPWFRHKYRHLVRNLRKNRNRLSSPYDLFMTLQHLLQLKSVNSSADVLPKSQACPECQSLFYPLPINRTCEQAGIPETWCACHPVLTVTGAPYAEKMINNVIRLMNDKLVARNLTDLCANYTLSDLINLDLKLPIDSSIDEYVDQYFIAKFETVPNKPEFELTFNWNNRTGALSFDIREISRLNSYENDSQCTNDKIAKKYCICKDAINPKSISE